MTKNVNVRHWKRLAAICSTILLAATVAEAGLIDPLTVRDNWTREIDPVTGNNNAAWAYPGGGAFVKSSNSNGTLISDSLASGDFSLHVTVTALKGDNDLMGLVFGWQDYQNTYMLSWGGGGVNGRHGDWNGPRLTRWDGGVRTELAGGSTPLWTKDVPYDFHVMRIGNEILARITNGATTILSESVTDPTYLSGQVGFQVHSQKTGFADIMFTASSTTSITVPEPGVSSLVVLALLALGIGPLRRARR